MNRKALSFLSVFSLAVLFSCNGQKGKSSVSLKSQSDSVAYAIGTSIGANMKKDGLDSINLELLSKGLAAALHGDSLVINPQQAQGTIQAYLGAKQKEKSESNMAAGKKFLEENKKKPGVKEMPDGLQYTVVKEGTGAMPVDGDTVVVNYAGTLVDGMEFDSNTGKAPAEFPIGAVIQGWTESLKMMKVGSKWEVFIPANLAWGDRGAGPKIPAGSAVIFDVELLSIKGK